MRACVRACVCVCAYTGLWVFVGEGGGRNKDGGCLNVCACGGGRECIDVGVAVKELDGNSYNYICAY